MLNDAVEGAHGDLLAAVMEAGGVFPIHAETPDDIPSREALLDRAMGLKRKRRSSEKLRRGRLPSEGLAFVARGADGSLVGTVRLWGVRMGKTGRPALLLGPLAVAPELKGRGIGAALMRDAIAEAKRRGHRAILLVGDAAYYARFGFSAQKTGRLSMPGPYEKERFLGLELVSGALDGAHGVLEPTGRPAQALSPAISIGHGASTTHHPTRGGIVTALG